MSKSINYSDEDRVVHMSICIKNDIKIYYKPISMLEGVIVVDYRGEISKSIDTYRGDNKPWRGKSRHKRIWSDSVMMLYTDNYLRLTKGISDNLINEL